MKVETGSGRKSGVAVEPPAPGLAGAMILVQGYQATESGHCRYNDRLVFSPQTGFSIRSDLVFQPLPTQYTKAS